MYTAIVDTPVPPCSHDKESTWPSPWSPFTEEEKAAIGSGNWERLTGHVVASRGRQEGGKKGDYAS